MFLDILHCNREVTGAEHMALLKYFKFNNPTLLDPEGPLSAHVSSDRIREANFYLFIYFIFIYEG